MNKNGRVYIVGAGCGDYDFITIRGKRLLEQCDTVIYDFLIDNRLLDFVSQNAERICVGKRAGCHSESQENINALLVKKAMEGKNIVRLKGGDPFVFGRGGEEIAALQMNSIEYSVIPGISSAIAVPELAGIPVTQRKVSRSFHVIAGHTAEDLIPENMNLYARLDGTLIFLMGLKNIGQISEMLIHNGKSENTPAAVISNGAGEKQQIVRGKLKNIADEVKKQELRTPVVIIVGDTAEYNFMPTISLLLRGISVTVTGTKKFAAKLSDKLSVLGAEVNRLDYLNVVEYRDNAKFDDALRNLNNYYWLVLTSINGAEIFFKKLTDLGIDVRALSKIKLAVIGSGTAEVLKRHGIIADLVPEIYTSEALGKMLSCNVRKNQRVLILRAEKGSTELTEILDSNNISYDDIKVYDVFSNVKDFNNKEINTDLITFASSSGVNAFFENGFKISSETKIICIGENTANTLKAHSIDHFIISATSNIDGIIETILGEIHNEKVQTSEDE